MGYLMQIEQLRGEFQKELEGVQTSGGIEALKAKYLGKKGPIQQLMKQLKDVSAEERPEFGKRVNLLKEEIESHFATALEKLASKELATQLAEENLDITLPGRRRFIGRKHPIVKTIEEIVDIHVGMGFSVQYSPDIESDYYNFEALNFAPDHPARDMQDTFYLDEHMLLRTQTTSIQMRIMENQKPPFRVVAAGNVYRNETVTARSHVFFHQVDAFYVDKGVTFASLLATFDEFLVKFFGGPVETRYRPSYFPFVEPGMEVDIRCSSCAGAGCSLCKHSGWLEIAGAGMIHPEILRTAGIDPEVYTGYAWGMGIDRLVMRRHGIPDIRLFTENDLRFLAQLG